MRVYFTALTVFLFISSTAYTQYFWEIKQSGVSLGGPIDVEKFNSDNVYYGSSGIIYKSTDRGETFFQLGTKIPNAINVKNIILNDLDPSEFIVAIESDEEKIVKTTDAGETWKISADSLTFTYFGIPTTPDPSHPDTIYAMDGDTLLRSEDFGDTWETVSEVPIPSDGPCDIEVFPDTSIILIGDNSIGIYRSTDYGETWEQTYNTTGEIPTIAIDYQTPGVAWASQWGGGGGGVLKSSDYGATWEMLTFFTGQNMWGIHVDPNNSDYIIAGRFSGGVMFISNDGGKNWVSANTGSTNFQVYIVDTMTVFAAQGNGLWKLYSSFIPVELVSFTGKLVKNKILLEWTTATENNNQGFDIELCYDTNSFEKIAFVPGYGTTTESKTYFYSFNKYFSGNVYIRLKQIDFDGSFEYSSFIEISEDIPLDFSLSQNHPNPFNPATSIEFSLAKNSSVRISIFNMLGEEVKKVISNDLSAGVHKVNFEAGELASGTYIYLLEAKTESGNYFFDSKKMLLLK